MRCCCRTRTPWNETDIPDQTGRVVVITGANSGTGFAAAQALAARGATVVLACRNVDKAQAAVAAIRAGQPGARLETQTLDLGDLASVRAAAAAILARHPRLDLLLNNAGVMVPPAGTTADGFETQFGTNHLGHFAFTGLLLERLLATPGARIVTMSSTAHKFGRMQFADLQFSRGYRAWAAYGQSKLANLLFTYELQRRLARAGQATLVVAAHPGWARTGLQRTAFQSGLEKRLTGFLGRFLSQDARHGALPLLRAALDPRVQGGAFYGPTGCFELVGRPDRVRSNRRSHDEAAQARLWQVSEQLTGVVYPV